MSRYKEYVPNERIVDRACALWVAMLRNPKYDNGDSSLTGVMTSMLARQLPKGEPDAIDRFSVELKKILMNGHKGNWSHGDKLPFDFKTVSSLHVDYGADIHLNAAAEAAGLKMEFPWKTSMGLTHDYLYVGYGYGAPYVYYYPLTGDRWLETRLSGDDITKIVALVESGVLTTQLEKA